jgi:simple sugar transport system substrate-binding protein
MGVSMIRKSVLVLCLLLLALSLALPTLAQDDGLIFGMVLVGPRNDRGWSQAHYEAGQYVTETIEGTEMLVFESLNPADAPETTLLQVVTEMVDQGATLIITTSDAFEEDTDAVAEAFPEVTFVNSSGDNALEGVAPPNVSNTMVQAEWAKAIAGCAAALSTETGNIGYLGPLINNETRRLVNSAYLGARYCYENYAGGDPDALVFTVTWIGFWFNIPGVTLDPTEVVNGFYDNGADVVMSGIDTPEAVTVASQRASQGEAVTAVAYDYVNGCDVAPDICLGVPYFNWIPSYTSIVQRVIDGTFEQEWTWGGPDWSDINNLETSWSGFLKGPGLSEENAAIIDEFTAYLAAFDEENPDGIGLWVGPITLQDGTVLGEEGVALDELEVWYMPQLLEGMIGPSE